MEREVQTKTLEWSSIVEFFTKRGRPLTKDQILKLVEEDRKEREAEEYKQRAEEEAERRRN
jgi:RNA:NAD 2'-phosphotransferase (TPT1/KptA family)